MSNKHERITVLCVTHAICYYGDSYYVC